MEQTNLTGYPSIDKPWLKYYSEEAINAPLPECTIYEYLWGNNKDYPDEIALIYENRKITYRELFSQIDRVASAFTSIGVKEGDVVTLMVLNQPETVYCLYALNKIGAVSCMINVLSSPKEIVHYMEECDSQYLIVLDALFEKAYTAFHQYPMKNLIYLPLYQSLGFIKKAAYRMKVKEPSSTEPEIISWDTFLRGATGTIPSVKKDCRTCAVIGHTGGTTGTPKGVMLSDYAVNALTFQYFYKLDYQRKDTFLCLIVPFAMFGLVINVHTPITLGITTILIPRVDAGKTDFLITKFHPNHILSIPSYWTAIASSQRIKDLHFLKTAGAGGSGMTIELEQKLNNLFIEKGANIIFLNGYGLSEVGSTACTQLYEFGEAGSVGVPIPKNTIAAFETEIGEEKKYNELGEICIQSPSVMLGYVGNEEETKTMIRTHADGSVWVHTGDIGYVNENGSVFIKGRMKRIYLTQYNGALAKIFPDRIERVLNTNPAVSDSCVVCIPNGENGYRPVAFCETGKSIEETAQIEKALLASCKEELPEYAVPVRFVFQTLLPRTAMGKIDYRALEERAAKEV